MTGVYNIITEVKKERIEALTKEGLKPIIIAERLGLAIQQIYYHQRELGLRKTPGQTKVGEAKP